jgi:hypothetical protein
VNPFEEFLKKILNPIGLMRNPPTEPAPPTPPVVNQAARQNAPIGGTADIKQQYADLFKSPLRDSLMQLAGVYNIRNTAGDHGKDNWVGAYYPRYSDLYFNTNPEAYGKFEAASPYRQTPASMDVSPRGVFVHEFGHPAEEYGNFSEDTKGLFSKQRLPKKIQPDRMGLGASMYDYERTQRSPLERKAELDVDPYYRHNPSEAFAQAFKNAFAFLQETARDPKIDYRKFAGDLEANTPGMGLILRDLMEHPLYEKHPLRGKVFTR